MCLQDYFSPPPPRNANSCNKDALHKVETQFKEKFNQIWQSLQQEFDENL